MGVVVMDKLGMGRLNGKRRREEEDEGWAGFRDSGRKKAETGLTPTAIRPGKKAPSANADRQRLRLMAPAREKGHGKFLVSFAKARNEIQQHFLPPGAIKLAAQIQPNLLEGWKSQKQFCFGKPYTTQYLGIGEKEPKGSPSEEKTSEVLQRAGAGEGEQGGRSVWEPPQAALSPLLQLCLALA